MLSGVSFHINEVKWKIYLFYFMETVFLGCVEVYQYFVMAIFYIM